MASYSGRKGRKAVLSDHHKFGSTDVRISSKLKRVSAIQPLTLNGEYDKPLAKINGAKSEKLKTSSEKAVADKHVVKLNYKQSGAKQNLKRAGNEPNQKYSSGTNMSTSSQSAAIYKKMRHVLREELPTNSARSSDKSASAVDETNTDDSLLDSDSESAVPSTTAAKQNLPSNVRITASKAKTSKGKSKESSKAVSANLKKSSSRNSDNEPGGVKLSKRLGLKRMKKCDFVAECLPSNSEAEDADVEDTDLQEVGNIGIASDDDCVFKKPKPPADQLKASRSATVGVKDRKKAAVQPTSSLSAGSSSKGRKKVVVEPTITSSQSESASSSDEGRKNKKDTVHPTSLSQSESASSSDEGGRKKKTIKSAQPVSSHSASSSSDSNRKTVRPVSSQSESASSSDEGKTKKTKASVRPTSLVSSQSAGVSAECRKKSSQSRSASSRDEGRKTKKVAVQPTSSQSAGNKKKAVEKTSSSQSESASIDNEGRKKKRPTKSMSSLSAGSGVEGRKNVVELTSMKVSSGATSVDARSGVSRKKDIGKHISRSSSSAHEEGSSDCESTDTDKRSSCERISQPPSRSLPGKENVLKRKMVSGRKKVEVKHVSSHHDNTAAVSEPVSKQRRINGNTEQRVAPSRGSKSAVKNCASHQDDRQSDTESDTSDNDLPPTKSKLQIAKERRWRKKELEKQQQKLKTETEEAQRAMMQKISAEEIDRYFKRLRSILQQPINS